MNGLDDEIEAILIGIIVFGVGLFAFLSFISN